MTETQAVSPEQLKQTIINWLKENGINHGEYRDNGCRFIFEKEWYDGDEGVGQFSPLTLISEGDLYVMWNEDPCFDQKPLKSLRELVASVGYYPEMGRRWSMHFYTLDQ